MWLLNLYICALGEYKKHRYFSSHGHEQQLVPSLNPQNQELIANSQGNDDHNLLKNQESDKISQVNIILLHKGSESRYFCF